VVHVHVSSSYAFSYHARFAVGELLAALEMINRFLKQYEEETEGFRTESKRRLASMNELLNSR
jgi:hypothetical protein